MKNYIYSANNNAFYPLELQGIYETSGTWPDDGVDVGYDVYLQFTASPPEGKVRGVVDGMPAWVDIPAPTHEQQVEAAVRKKNSFRSEADAEIAWLQDAADVGIATDEETALLAAWKTYRVKLMRVDTTKAPGIEWPEVPSS